MDVHKSSLLAIFDAKQRLEVPLFQRQYVWNEEQHWTPLWEDIERKFTEALDGRKDAPNHFLGAMVFDQKQTPCDPLAAECDKFLFNTGMMADVNVDKFKVWPTQLDRGQFTDVISAGSQDEVLRRHPLRRKPYARKPDPRPRMVESYLFFFDQIKSFFLGTDGAEPLGAEHPILARVDECFQTLRNGLMVVIIDLQKDDDPQLIFETLNARGEPLLPADLLRNYIFFRARGEKLDIEAVYTKYWSGFDEEFWREEVKQGRLTRPRSDLFMQHFLASQQGQDIPIKHLYVEYRHWLETTHPFPSITAELTALARQRDHFRRIIAPQEGDVVSSLCRFLEAYDIRTVYPLLLALMGADLKEAEWKEISRILESYLIRRAICDLGTKNYNRIFLSVTRNLRKDGFAATNLKQLLLAQIGESSVWPDDASFREAWLHKPLYGSLNNPKLVHLYRCLNQTYMSSKSEALTFLEQPSVEHIMPQDWIANWPLPDGSKGMNLVELIVLASENDDRAISTRKRNVVVQTLGNLTILSFKLNAAQSNLGWDKKLPEMMKHSLLPLNQSLADTKEWNEAAILNRGERLFDRALQVWRR
jgi:Protein of unknown function (DUF1524)/Protein of unknown function DUF262